MHVETLGEVLSYQLIDTRTECALSAGDASNAQDDAARHSAGNCTSRKKLVIPGTKELAGYRVRFYSNKQTYNERNN
jgi:hypothetical protein